MLRSPKRPITLLVITRDQVLRADGKNGNLRTFFQSDRPARTPLPAAVELAISLSKEKPAQQTIVIADEIWTGVIDVDERSIAGLEGDELDQMLRFETETLSNLDPMNSQIGILELAPVPPDTRRFWCSAIASEVLAGINAAVMLRGGKCQFCTHPAGMANPEMRGIPWVEFTENLAGAYMIGGDGLPRASIAPRSKTSNRWYKAFELNFGSELPDEGWQLDSSAPPEAYTGNLQRIDTEEKIQHWINILASRLYHTTPIPVVAPPVPETTAAFMTQVGVIAATVITMASVGHFLWTKYEIQSVEQEIVSLREPRDEKLALERDIAKLTKQIAENTVSLTEQVIQRRELQLLTERSDRYADLLKQLAITCDQDIVVDDIKPSVKGIRLSGRALKSESPNMLAIALGPKALQMGWSVSPPSLTGENKLVNGGPWKFHLELADITPEAHLTETFQSTLANQAFGKEGKSN